MEKFIVSGAAAMLAVLVGMAFAPPVEAVCRPPYEVGTWINASVEGADITRLEISSSNNCWDSDAKWQPYKGPSWYVEAFGQCGSLDCSWGEIGAEQQRLRRGIANPEGPELTARSPKIKVYPIFAAFRRNGSQKYLYIYITNELYIRTLYRGDNVLVVRVFTDYPDGEQPDTTEVLKFHRLATERRFGDPLTLVNDK